MPRHKMLLSILSLLLAVSAPLFMAFKARSDQNAYPVVRIEIEPYDPRDLLYGHYMTFLYKWNLGQGEYDKAACRGADCCLCLEAGDQDPKATVMACLPEKPAQCAHVLKGSYYANGNFDIGLNRYYVDENIALPLEKLFRNEKERFHVGLSIAPSGKPILEKLYVGGQAVNDYIADHYQELTAPAPQDDATP